MDGYRPSRFDDGVARKVGKKFGGECAGIDPPVLERWRTWRIVSASFSLLPLCCCNSAVLHATRPTLPTAGKGGGGAGGVRQGGVKKGGGGGPGGKGKGKGKQQRPGKARRAAMNKGR